MSVLTLGLIHHNQPPVSVYTISSNPYKRYEPFTTTRLGLFKFQVVRFLQRLIYGTQRYQELFPPISKLQKITNRKQQSVFPVNCAADDLDLGFGESDQIELFDNGGHAHPQKRQHELADFDEFLDSSIQSHSHFHHHQLPTFNEDIFQPVTIIGPHQAPPQPVQLTLPPAPNATIVRNPQVMSTNFYDYFNDFIAQNKEDGSTVSSESYISPLDDEILGGIIPLLQNDETPMQRLLSTSSTDSYHASYQEEDEETQHLSSSCSSSSSSIHQHFHENHYHAHELKEELPSESNEPVEEIKLKIEPTDDDRQPLHRKRKLESTSPSASSPSSSPLSMATTTNSSSSPKSSTSAVTNISISSSAPSTKRLSKKKRNEPPKETTTVTTTTVTNNIQVRKTTTTTVEGVTTSLFFCPHPHCNSVFKVKGYLTRHLKKHNANKTFLCPFYGQDSKCHPSGGFSRRDTFKTHLKALHFVYPAGTKSLERNFKSGRCGGCFLFFDNNADWLQNHIEAGLCTGVVNYRESLGSLLD
ncbi:Transcriptional regulator STP3 [Candida viswanathii]|uniref:Transcriptional regulator STP3 n=1 Tax=Candida viswanathii TaxID=5486 RepID=A0A367YI02_9ASCO|nr:Transcriptional regulator STP3 [Candida viswanathii]